MTRFVLSIFTAAYIVMLPGCATNPLHNAISQNNSAEVSNILASGIPVDSRDEYARTPLMIAAENGHTELARLLLDRGASANASSMYGDTPLIWAATEGNTDTARLLIERGANVNAVSNDGDTSLILTTVNGHAQTVKLLIEKGANVNTPNNVGNTPLMMAARIGNTEITSMLLKKGAAINATSHAGDTPLIFAGAYGQPETAKLLIANGAKVDARNVEGKTGAQLAQENGHTATYNAIVTAQQSNTAGQKKKSAPSPKLVTELKALIAKKDMTGLRNLLDAHPEMLSAITDTHLRLLYTGPAELRIADIEKLANAKTRNALIIAQINSTAGPYKKFTVDELADLKKMGIPDEVVAAMITVTTEYNKEQQRLAEQQRAIQAATPPPAPQPAQQQQVAEAETSTPVECLKLVAAIKACDQTSGFLSMGCKAVANSQFDCPIPIETLMH